MRGGAWVSYEEERHTRFSFASIKSKSIRKGTLARPLGNIPQRLFCVSSGTGCALAQISRMIREPCGGEWARVQIGRFVGFVEKR